MTKKKQEKELDYIPTRLSGLRGLLLEQYQAIDQATEKKKEIQARIDELNGVVQAAEAAGKKKKGEGE